MRTIPQRSSPTSALERCSFPVEPNQETQQEEFRFVRRIIPVALGLATLLSGCATPFIPVQTITSVIPSSTGTPNSIAVLGSYEFVSVQGTGQIFTYNISSGSQV